MPSFFPLLSLLRRRTVLGLLGTLVACGQSSPSTSSPSMQPYQTEKFELTAGPCAAEGYPVTIQSGVFIGSDGKAFSVPSGHFLDGDWGMSGTVWSSGDDRHPAPARLSLTWFAYAENKFYQDEFLLPQERIYQLLKQGSWDITKQKQVTYNRFIVCVLPKGVVVVWLTGGNQVLLGRYHAREKWVTRDEFVRYYGPADRASMVQEERDQLPEQVQAEIQAGTLSTRSGTSGSKRTPGRSSLPSP
jgi:hypothetical protein